MEPVAVPSVLDAVTVYAQGALCTRLVRVEPVDGKLPAALKVTGLPLSMRAGWLRARVLQGPPDLRVQDVRPGFVAVLPEEVDIPLEQKALEEAERARDRLEARHALLRREVDALKGLRPTFPPPRKGAPPRAAPVSTLLELGRFVDEDLRDLQQELHALDQEVEDARAKVDLRRRRLAEASTSKRVERARLERTALLTLGETCQPGPVEIAVDYFVPGARWVPSYDLRLDRTMQQGTLRLRASVAQETGEDWKDVRLALSTADLERRAEHPELKSLRVGRAQPPPPRSGWRAPPPGLDDLFSAYDDVRFRPPGGLPAGSSTTTELPMPRRRPATDAKKKAARPPEPECDKLAPPPPAPPCMAAPSVVPPGGMAVPTASFGGAVTRSAAPSRVQAKVRFAAKEEEVEERRAPVEANACDDDLDEACGSVAEDASGYQASPSLVSPDDALLDYGALLLGGADDKESRGKLVPSDPDRQQVVMATSVNVQVEVLLAVLQASRDTASRVEALPLPHHAEPVRHAAGSYAYRYDADHRVDVESDGAWHTVPVMTADVGVTPRFVCVPLVESKVFRTVNIENRSPHALLAGPVEVTLGEEFLLTVRLPTIPARGAASAGLGVEESIQVARNTRFKESTGGLISTTAVLQHEIEIDVVNHLQHPAPVEVRERVPVAEDGDIKVEETSSQPPWKGDSGPRDGVYALGARSWLLTLAPGEKRTLTAQYVVKIPGDKMLLGGNRRV
jgi:hypothetical protein